MLCAFDAVNGRYSKVGRGDQDDLTAINQYMVHSEMCASWGYERLHQAIEKQAVQEMHHAESLIGRYDSVTGQSPEVDLTNEDSARNISRRHARFVMKDGKPYVAEEIGTMNGTFLNNQKIPTGVLTPIKDGDEFTLCRLALTFRLPSPK